MDKKVKQNFFLTGEVDGKNVEKNIIEEANKEASKFQTYRKKPAEVYDAIGTANSLGRRISKDRTVLNTKTKEAFEKLVDQSFNNPSKAAELSKSLKALDPNYSKMLNYFINMYKIRYTVTPKSKDKTQEIKSELYMESYRKMVRVVEGMNLETNMPTFLEHIYKLGSINLYAMKHTSSETVVFFILPMNFCYKGNKTSFGTQQVLFDFKFFNQFQGEVLEKVLSIFPKEFKSLHAEYVKNPNVSRLPLDARFSAHFAENDLKIPPLIAAMGGKIEFDTARKIDLEKNENLLKSILTHKIPIDSDGNLVFELDEVIDIQRAINAVLKSHPGLETITVFGDTELLRLQEESGKENKQVAQAFANVYNTAGMNATFMTDANGESYDFMHSIDKSAVWKIIQEIQEFINLAANNLYTFKPLEVRIKFLDIPNYKSKEAEQSYRENATFGLGRIEALVATGVKQSELEDRHRLEQELNLDELLIPLQSAHTQNAMDRANSGTVDTGDSEESSKVEEEEKNKKEEKKKEKEKEKDKEVK